MKAAYSLYVALTYFYFLNCVRNHTPYVQITEKNTVILIYFSSHHLIFVD